MQLCVVKPNLLNVSKGCTASARVTCTQACCEHQSRACRVISDTASNGHNSAGVWVEEEIRRHCHGVSTAQKHAAVSFRSDEARHRIAVNSSTGSQGPIRILNDRKREVTQGLSLIHCVIFVGKMY